MRPRSIVVVLSLLLCAASAGAQVCQVCVAAVGTARGPAGSSGGGEGRYLVEQAELQSSLTGLGFSHQVAADPNSTACDVYVTFPGSSAWDTGLFSTWVQAGHGLVQISDWGPNIQGNTYLTLPDPYPPQAVTVVDAGHPITAGLPSSWTTLGFWHYEPGVVEDYIGWVTAADPNLAQIAGNDRGLSARSEGSGRVVYVGWNVYGANASADDLAVLANALQWAGECAIPVELQSLTAE